MSDKPALAGHPFEDFTPGKIWRAGPSEPFTETSIIAYAKDWDRQRFHLDAEAAKKSIYGGLIASGMHTFSVIFRLFDEARVFGDYFEGGIGANDIRWSRPVRPGDSLTAIMEIAEARPSRSVANCGVVKSRVRAENQRGEEVMSMLSVDLLRRRDG